MIILFKIGFLIASIGFAFLSGLDTERDVCDFYSRNKTRPGMWIVLSLALGVAAIFL